MSVFLLLGLGLLVTSKALDASTGDERGPVVSAEARIDLDEAIVQAHAEQFQRAYGREPTLAESAQLVALYVEEEAMYREALRLGLDRGDTIVRRRLIQLVEFMYQDLGEQSLEERCAAERFHDQPPLQRTLVDFEQRFVEQPEQSLVRRRVIEEYESDPFPLGNRFRRASREDVERSLGAALAQAVFEAPLREWRGPFASPYGTHWVKVDSRSVEVEDEAKRRKRLVSGCMVAARKELLQDEIRRLVERQELHVSPAFAERFPEIAERLGS